MFLCFNHGSAVKECRLKDSSIAGLDTGLSWAKFTSIYRTLPKPFDMYDTWGFKMLGRVGIELNDTIAL